MVAVHVRMVSESVLFKSLYIYEGIRGLIDIIVGNRHGDESSNPGQDCLSSHSTNSLWKSMNPIILPPATGE